MHYKRFSLSAVASMFTFEIERGCCDGIRIQFKSRLSKNRLEKCRLAVKSDFKKMNFGVGMDQKVPKNWHFQQF